MSNRSYFSSQIAEAEAVLGAIGTEAMAASVSAAASLISDAILAGGKVMLAGNGGSAADAQHLAAELIGRFFVDRNPWAAIALSDNVAAVTAVGNDYSYEEVFARPLRGLGRPGDVFLGLTTSGRSRNVLVALKTARSLGITTIAMVGADFAQIEPLADRIIAVPGPNTARIQEGHKLLGHIMFAMVERTLSD
jgi:D-sedoheptulose 7-phosphate isomerase